MPPGAPPPPSPVPKLGNPTRRVPLGVGDLWDARTGRTHHPARQLLDLHRGISRLVGERVADDPFGLHDLLLTCPADEVELASAAEEHLIHLAAEGASGRGEVIPVRAGHGVQSAESTKGQGPVPPISLDASQSHMPGWSPAQPQTEEGKWAMRKAIRLAPKARTRHPSKPAATRGPTLYRVALTAASLVLLGACSGSGGSEGDITLVADVTETGSQDPLGYALAGDEVTGVGPTLTVQVGEPVTLMLENHDELEPHNFAVVPKLDDIRKAAALGNLGGEILWESSIDDLDEGESGSVTFTPDAVGEYYYVCTRPGHVGAGMMGELIVVEGE